MFQTSINISLLNDLISMKIPMQMTGSQSDMTKTYLIQHIEIYYQLQRSLLLEYPNGFQALTVDALLQTKAQWCSLGSFLSARELQELQDRQELCLLLYFLVFSILP